MKERATWALCAASPIARMTVMRPAALLALLCMTFSTSVLAAPQAQLDKDKAKIAKLKAEYSSSKAAYAKKSKNATVKKKYVDATVTYATAVMNSPSMAPKDKYTSSLRLYREALKTDPNNKVAKTNSKMIEDIYRSMGRPIPK